MANTEPIKTLLLTQEQQELVERIRGQVKDVEEGEYAYGVVDALAYVWAGMPENAVELYRGTNSRFAALMREAMTQSESD